MPRTKSGKLAAFSRHAAQQAALRNLVLEEVEYILTYGRQVHHTGTTF